MNKLFTLFFFAACLVIQIKSYAQCGTCTPDQTCYQPQGAQCPASGQAPPMYVNQPYSTDVTFYMPPDTNVAVVGTVDIINVNYASITGLPNGITWECNNSSNSCNYNPSAGEKWACIRFCGTPVCLPGTYTVTINIVGTAQTPLGPQNQNQPLNYTFTVLPGSNSNPGFTFSPANGCDSIASTFSALINLGAPQTTEWDWNFGNGNTSTVQNPPIQSYGAPGNYPVTLSTNIYNFVFNSCSASSSGNWWCGDVEEPSFFGACTGSPDLYFKLTNGSNTYTSSVVDNNTSASWNNVNQTLQNLSISLSFWDDDNVSQDDDGGTYSFLVPGAGTYNFTTASPFGGGVSGSFTIVKALDTSVVVTDTVRVYELPPVPQFTIIPNDTVCEKEYITISVYDGDFTYEWYKNGNVMQGADSNSIRVTAPAAAYKVKITNPVTGCVTMSGTFQANFFPDVYNVLISNQNGVLIPNPPTGYAFQWMYNGAPIFPDGTTPTFTPKVTGLYSCIFTNQYGCSDTSNVVSVTSLVGIDEQLNVSQSISVYPNPAGELITLDLTPVQEPEIKLTVYDAVGRQVLSKNLNTVSVSIHSLDISSLTSGMYILEIKGEKKFGTKRILKK